MLLAFVVSPRPRSKVPVREQWLAAGAALGNLLNAAYHLGFGAIMLSGERCFDPVLTAELGVGREEFLAGFVSLGSVAQTPPPRQHVQPAEVLSRWLPDTPEDVAVNAYVDAGSASLSVRGDAGHAAGTD